MSHLNAFPTIPIPLSAKFIDSEPLRMSPVSDSLDPSTPTPNDDMLAWLAPPVDDFEHSTPPHSPCISIGEDPLLFDLDMETETDPVTPDALFSITDLMDVDGHGIGLHHHHIDSEFDLSMPHREHAVKDVHTAPASQLSGDVVSDTQDSFTSANGHSKTPSPRQATPSAPLVSSISMQMQSQTIENVTLEPLSSRSLRRLDTAVSEKTASPAGKRNPKRSPIRRLSMKAESPTAAIAKNRGSPASSTDKMSSNTQGDVMKGVRSMHLSARKRARTAPSEDDTGGKGEKPTVTKGGESSQCKTTKARMRFRRMATERRMGKVSEEEKNVPVLDKCVKCSTMAKHTPMMRKGPDGCRSLCNACGLKWSRHGIF